MKAQLCQRQNSKPGPHHMQSVILDNGDSHSIGLLPWPGGYVFAMGHDIKAKWGGDVVSEDAQNVITFPGDGRVEDMLYVGFGESGG